MGTMHSTNQAFERYFQRQESDAKAVYEEAKDLQQAYNQKGVDKKGKMLNIDEKIGGGGGSRTYGDPQSNRGLQRFTEYPLIYDPTYEHLSSSSRIYPATSA